MKFSKDDSPIGIGSQCRNSQSGNVCVFWVRDFGRGIPLAERAQIFDEFTQSRSSDAGKGRGMGLGLFITAQLVEAQGARIWVESEVGEGSVFFVEFAALLEKPMNAA